MARGVTLGDLIDKLEEYGRHVEVRIVHQQSYPLQEVIGGVFDPKASDTCVDCDLPRDAADRDKAGEDYDHDFEGAPGADENVIYLVANGHPEKSSYGSREAWDLMEQI